MKKIIISRTDNIGDVILTLPLTGLIKESYPGCRIVFLGKSYTKALIDACVNIDEFIDFDEIKKMSAQSQIIFFKNINADAIIHVYPQMVIARLACKVRIPIRIGTSRRPYNLIYCNRLVNLSRRFSDLHEAQLNIKLLSALNISCDTDIKNLHSYSGLANISSEYKFPDKPDNSRFNLILHPKSKGSAREWGLENYSNLISLLPPDKFRIFITGTDSEGHTMESFIEKHKEQVINTTGKFTLPELLSFIKDSDCIVSASTGPLHFASSIGKYAIGLFAPIRPMHPGRWGALGNNAHNIVIDKKCNSCRKKSHCECIEQIPPEQIASLLLQFYNSKFTL